MLQIVLALSSRSHFLGCAAEFYVFSDTRLYSGVAGQPNYPISSSENVEFIGTRGSESESGVSRVLEESPVSIRGMPSHYQVVCSKSMYVGIDTLKPWYFLLCPNVELQLHYFKQKYLG